MIQISENISDHNQKRLKYTNLSCLSPNSHNFAMQKLCHCTMSCWHFSGEEGLISQRIYVYCPKFISVFHLQSLVQSCLRSHCLPRDIGPPDGMDVPYSVLSTSEWEIGNLAAIVKLMTATASPETNV